MNEKTIAVGLAKEAGAIMRTNFIHGMKKEWKADGTPLTATDTAVNALVVEKISAAFPNHGILTEESAEVNPNAEYAWVCDPVDGTIPFSHGVPTAVFSLALVRDGKPILGVIYDPFMDRLFTAEEGKGAELNGKPIRVSESASFKHEVFSAVIWPGVVEVLIPLVQTVVRQGAIQLSCGSNVYAGALVATGELCASVFPGTFPWDVAAVKILVEEAGGRVTDIHGNDQRYDRAINGAIISNGKVHDQLLSLMVSSQ